MLSIDINSHRQKGQWKKLNGYFTFTRDGEHIARIDYTIKAEQSEIVLSWLFRKEPREQKIRLTTTRQPFGHERYYYECPKCKSRVFKLYAGTEFYCRKCWNLTYVSCQESHCFDSMRKYGMNPRLMTVLKKLNEAEYKVLYATPETREKSIRRLNKLELRYAKYFMGNQ